MFLMCCVCLLSQDDTGYAKYQCGHSGICWHLLEVISLSSDEFNVTHCAFLVRSRPPTQKTKEGTEFK